MVGLENEDEDFWKNLKGWNVIVMCETWIQEKGWERIRKKLPKGYRWEVQEAEKKNKKERAMGGMTVDTREELEEKEEGRVVEEEG